VLFYNGMEDNVWENEVFRVKTEAGSKKANRSAAESIASEAG